MSGLQDDIRSAAVKAYAEIANLKFENQILNNSMKDLEDKLGLIYAKIDQLIKLKDLVEELIL